MTAKGELYRGLQAWSDKYLNGHADRAKAESGLLVLFEAYEAATSPASGPERDLEMLERLARRERIAPFKGIWVTRRADAQASEDNLIYYDVRGPFMKRIERADILALLKGAK